MNTSTAMSGAMWVSQERLHLAAGVLDDRSDEVILHRALETPPHGDHRLALAVLHQAALGLEQRVAQDHHHVTFGDRRVRLRGTATGVIANEADHGGADRLRGLTARLTR